MGITTFERKTDKSNTLLKNERDLLNTVKLLTEIVFKSSFGYFALKLR